MRTLTRGAGALAVAAALCLPSLARAQGSIEQIALRLLAERFGISTNQAIDFQRVSRLDVFEAAPVYSTSYYTHRPVNEVWRLRRQGLGWGQIAQRLGMNPGTFNKLRAQGAFDRDALWGSIIKRRYDARDADLAAVRRRGASARDLFCSFHIARETRREPVVIYRRYRSDRDWNRTAAVYKPDLRYDDKPAKRMGKADARRENRAEGAKKRDWGSSSKVRGHGNGKDAANPGKDRNKGRKAIGQGNGRGKGVR